MFKKTDIVVVSAVALLLGVFVVTQFYSAKEYKKATEPQNNEVMAIEVANLTKANAGLRQEAVDLTQSLDSYKNASESSKKSQEAYLADIDRYDVINGLKRAEGQGVIVGVDGLLSSPQITDLINAIKNIGGELIAINGERIEINTYLAKYSGMKKYEIKVLGNGNLFKSALERKGGIVEQISNKDIHFSISEQTNLEVPVGEAIKFNYAKIVN